MSLLKRERKITRKKHVLLVIWIATDLTVVI